MAATNHERVGKAIGLLRDGLAPFVEREIQSAHGGAPEKEALRYLNDDRLGEKPIAEWDAYALLKLMWEAWNTVFRKVLGAAERSYVKELQDARNRWAHQENFSSDDAYRAMDSATRLLTAVSAPEADEVEKMKMELLRLRFDEQSRQVRRRTAQTALETQVTSTLTPWREIITPHRDVASGRYQQAEFAADLWQVHLGEGSDEYRNPAEFFRRTYLTESLRRLLVTAVRRLGGDGGADPVVQLQTNFGGGKTHSMLALYHLFSGTSTSELAGVEALMAEAEVAKLPSVRRAVLVGNKISPGNPDTKADGTVVRTLWGELAWQFGGREAYDRIAADDEKATSPGHRLKDLFNDFGPCLILIDEWVAYARQLHDQSDLPAGGFETQFTFAQALTESAKAAKHCLLVISLPASDTAGGSPHATADDVEVGGVRGREALDRLRNVVGRLESSWRPASAEEGFEIVRRRLFEPLSGDQFKQRDVVARAFSEFYGNNQPEFPPECREGDYEKRIKDAYPIHPEIFDRLYTDWSTLVKFQRTRGVLRLMASVIHSLWEKGDRNPLILPSMIPIDDPRVQFELTRYLSDNWVPIIEKDVDGPNSLPLKIDADVPNLGKVHACRRVARTVYLGSAPTKDAAHKGLEDRRVKLGCVMPGESPAVFGDALRRLAAAATYLYQDGARVWYDTQPTVTKLAEDRAEQLKREEDRVESEIERRIRADVAHRGDFARVHPLPKSGADVPDDLEARLVVLGPAHAHTKDGKSPAVMAAEAILESRGAAPRLFRNTLVFLAVDATRLQDLDEAVRKFIAWESILGDADTLNLTPFQKKQAETQRSAADGAVKARLPESYQWLLVPGQKTPQSTLEWHAIRVGGTDPLAARASKKLRSEELLVPKLGGSVLQHLLEKIPLWRGDHVAVRQLAEDFARYPYLQRLADPGVLASAAAEGVGLLTWQTDGFAYADSYDEEAGRYRGLRGGQAVSIAVDDPGLIVRADVASSQLEADRAKAGQAGTGAAEPGAGPDEEETGGSETEPEAKVRPRRFYGSASIDPLRAGTEVGRIAEEVISHLAGLKGAEVRLTLEIEARMPDGASEHVVRTVTENARTLKFSTQGFEEE